MNMMCVVGKEVNSLFKKCGVRERGGREWMCRVFDGMIDGEVDTEQAKMICSVMKKGMLEGGAGG